MATSVSASVTAIAADVAAARADGPQHADLADRAG